MKHILPILTLTTLAAAASAQSAAAPAGLSYNRVSVSRAGQENHLAVSQLLGSSNVLLGLSNRSYETTYGTGTTDYGNYTFLSVGYVFKNVGGFADVLAIAGSDETYGIRVRKDLGNNFEAGIQYLKGGVGDSEYGIQLGYNVSKQVSVDLGYIRIKDAVGSADATQWSLGLRYNF